MPLYVAEYLGDTGHLSTTQHGAYLLLIMHYWRKHGLPDEDKQLAAITKLPLRLWLDCRETLQAFFYDGWKHKRIDAELSKRIELSNKRAAAGSRGGEVTAFRNEVNAANAGICRSMKHKQRNISSTVRSERGPGNGSSLSVSPELEAILARGKT